MKKKLDFTPEQLAFASGTLLDEFGRGVGVVRDGASDSTFRAMINRLAFNGAHWSDAISLVVMASDATLRDYFAAKAQAGMLANYNVINTPEHVAQMAYAHADAMLAERAK